MTRRTIGGVVLLAASFGAAAMGLGLEAQGAIPQAAKDDPRFALGYLAVTRYPGVKADGTGDCTAGIQAAIQDAYENHLAVLFPPGEYLISDTLKCYEWNFWSERRGQANNPDRRNHVLIGSALGEKRPVIKLAAGAPRFGDPDNPRPMIAYRVFTAINAKGVAPVEPDEPILGDPPNFRDQPNILFDSELRGIDFDCGGNPGAVGIVFRAAQDSSIEDVKVWATGASSGIRGIPGRNCGAANVEVEGGRFGLDLVDGGLAGTQAFGIRLIGQTELAVRSSDFCPLALVGFQIVKDRGPAIVVDNRSSHDSSASGAFSLIDGSIELRKGGLAIDNTPEAKTLYLRNVYIKGADGLVKSGAEDAVEGAGGEWSRIREYVYTDQRLPGEKPAYGDSDNFFRTFSLIDGTLSREAQPVCVIESAAAAPADLLSRHVWENLPSYEGQNDGTKVVASGSRRTENNEAEDSRPAIQAAIDEASAEGHGRVFLPAGEYRIGGTLNLRANTKLFGVGRRISVIACHDSWRPTEGEATMLLTDNDPQADTTLAFLSIEARALGGGTNAIGANDWDRFNHIHWRAGRGSMIVAIQLDKEWTTNEQISNPHDYLKFTDSGGGRHYFLCPSTRWFGKHPDSRAVRVAGTREPLAFYGLNLEFVARTPETTPKTNVEMIGTENVRIYGVKREMATSTLILRDCRNVALFNHGRQASQPFRGSGGHFQILGASDNIAIGPAIIDVAHGTANGEPMLRESLAGGATHEILYPECISIYKRGELDDSVFAPASKP